MAVIGGLWLRVRFELVDGSEECHDYQEVRIQEQVRAPALADSARASGRDASREWLARAESGALVRHTCQAHLSGALVRCTGCSSARSRARSRCCCRTASLRQAVDAATLAHEWTAGDRTTSSTRASPATTSPSSALCASAGGPSRAGTGPTRSSPSTRCTCTSTTTRCMPTRVLPAVDEGASRGVAMRLARRAPRGSLGGRQRTV